MSYLGTWMIIKNNTTHSKVNLYSKRDTNSFEHSKVLRLIKIKQPQHSNQNMCYRSAVNLFSKVTGFLADVFLGTQ